MSDKVSIQVGEATAAKLGELAAPHGLSVDKLAEVLLEAFVEAKGRVYVSPWKEGPGVRILPDWPKFSIGVFKVKEDEMK